SNEVHNRATQTGQRFMEKVRGLRLAQVREVRGRGLMLAVELKKPATPVIKAMQERGVLALPGGGTVIRFLPSILIEDAQLNDGNAVIYGRWRNRRPADIVRWHRRVQQQVLLTLRERPDDWFSGKERGASWPGDFDGHSAWHRVRDIEAAISGTQKNKPPSGRLSKDSPKRSVDDGRR